MKGDVLLFTLSIAIVLNTEMSIFAEESPPVRFRAGIISYGDGGTYFSRTINNRNERAGFFRSNGNPTAETAFITTATEIKSLGTLGGTSSRITALSNDKWAAGRSLDSTGVQRAFLYWDDYMEDLSFFQPAGFGESAALGVSDLGHVTGWIKTSDGQQRAFSYSQGEFRVLPEFGLYHTGYDIDEAGTIVGAAGFEDGTLRAFVYRRRLGEPQFIPPFGGNSSVAYAIQGATFQVVGEAETEEGKMHAFLYHYADKTMDDLGTLGGETSKAFGINRAGDVVGESLTSEGKRRAFLFSGGAMRDLNWMVDPVSPVILNSALAINDHGAILAEGAYAGETAVCLLTLESPRILSIKRSSIQVRGTNDRRLYFEILGPVGGIFVIERSSDLSSWQNTPATGITGIMELEVSLDMDSPWEFYRVGFR